MDAATAYEANADGPLLTVSIVTFKPDLDEMRRTLTSLEAALDGIEPEKTAVFIIDNSPKDSVSSLLAGRLAGRPLRIFQGHGNIGFGKGHNLALAEAGRFHLILNPDIEMEADAIRKALDFMHAHPDCGLVTPMASWPDGTRQYLCKRFPAAFDLLLRGFAPAFVKRLFDRRLSHYEMRAETSDTVFWDPPIVSGCFMLFRGAHLKDLHGFDPGYLLYFEDFDLSLRSAKRARTAYVPMVKIIHSGGHAARKGLWHIRQFTRSALHFYRTYGLKLF